MIIFIIFETDDLEKFKNRAPLTFKKIFDEYNGKIYNFILIKTGRNRELTGEIFSEVFYTAVVKASSLKNIEKVLSWLLSIAVNKIIDNARKEKVRRNYLESIAGQAECHDEKTVEDVKLVAFNIALEEIKPKYCEILKLKFFEKKTVKEIAGYYKLSIPSVESLLQRAKAALKKEIIRIIKEYEK